jgi:hypothetical protein
MRLSRRTLAIATLTTAGLFLAVAAVATSHLPDHCWDVGRPNLLAFTRAAIIVMAAVWAIGAYTLLRCPGRARLILAAVVLAELAAWLEVVHEVRQRMPAPCG